MKKTREDRNESARDIILEAAKQHCAQHGWSRMTVRAIADYAKVNSALLGYYFENKEALARELIQSTSERLDAWRRDALEEMHKDHGEVIPIEALVRVFSEPFLLKKHALRDDVRVYLSTTMHLLGNPTDALVDFARSANRNTNNTFLLEVRRALPQADAETLHVRFEMMLGSMVFTSALVNSRGVPYFSQAMLTDEKLLTQFAQDWAAVFSLPTPNATPVQPNSGKSKSTQSA